MKLKIKTGKFKISKKYIFIFIISIVIIAFIYIGWFIYNNIQQAVTYTGEIIVYKNEVAPESFDITEFDNALLELDKKIKYNVIDQISNLKNIFKENKIPNIISPINTSSEPIIETPPVIE